MNCLLRICKYEYPGSKFAPKDQFEGSMPTPASKATLIWGGHTLHLISRLVMQ